MGIFWCVALKEIHIKPSDLTHSNSNNCKRKINENLLFM